MEKRVIYNFLIEKPIKYFQKHKQLRG